MPKKYIVLDTETTGLEVKQGHRIIEIGAVLVNNRVKSDQHFHSYLNPQRSNVFLEIGMQGIVKISKL